MEGFTWNTVRLRLPPFPATSSEPSGVSASVLVFEPPGLNGEPATAAAVVALPLPETWNTPTRALLRAATM